MSAPEKPAPVPNGNLDSSESQWGAHGRFNAEPQEAEGKKSFVEQHKERTAQRAPSQHAPWGRHQ